jgi:hypothetical protein
MAQFGGADVRENMPQRSTAELRTTPLGIALARLLDDNVTTPKSSTRVPPS